MEFVKYEFSFSKLVTASLILFFRDNSEIKDWFLISSFNLINSLFNELIFQSVELMNADGEVVHRWQHIPEGQMLSTELIIPCDTNVLFNIHSDKYGDKNSVYQGVQHSFWLQEWGMKEDAVPGLEGGTWMYVQPNEAGVWPIRCAEYCGEYHSLMIGQVEVVVREGMNCDEDFGIYFEHEELRA